MLLIKAKPSEDDILPPQLPDKPRLVTGRTTVFGGLVRPEEADAEHVCAMTDMSPAAYPALRTRAPRCLWADTPGSGTSHGIALHGDSVICARGTGLFQCGQAQTAVRIGTVGDTDKTIVSFGDDLLILPDGCVKRAGASACTPINIAVERLSSAAIQDDMLLAANIDFEEQGFAVGDCIHVEVLDRWQLSYLSGDYKIKALHEGSIRIKGSFPGTGTVDVRVSRTVPDLAGACVVGDRIYGFKGNEVYVCEAGNPFNWYAVDPDAPENAPVHFRTGTDTPFTACVAWQGYPTFFKRDRVCRLVGRSVGYSSDTAKASSLALSDLPAPGVGAGMARTLCEVGGALYYCADVGIYRYSGTYPTRIDRDLWPGLEGVCAGTDGRSYYLSCTVGGEPKLLLYRPEGDVGSGWYAENDADAVFMTDRPQLLPAGREAVCLYQTTDGTVWMTRSYGPALTGYDTEADMDLTLPSPAVEFGDDLNHLPDGGRLLSVSLRAKGALGAVVRVTCRWEGSPEWTEIGTLTGTDDTMLYRMPVLPRHAGWYRLRLELTGAWTIYGVFRETEQNR